MVKTVLPLKGGADLIPGQETKISHAVQPKTNKQTKDNNNKKLELAGLWLDSFIVTVTDILGRKVVNAYCQTEDLLMYSPFLFL